MCLIFIALNQHPRYKLIVAANRDEFYNRKTAAASYWNDFPNVVGGRDLEAGGTWMGMTTAGRISMITNYRDPAHIRPDAPSRGHLVSDFLEKELNPSQYIREVRNKATNYNGFNLIAGTTRELWYVSNYKQGISKLEDGLYGLSNHLLDSPWPKVEKGKAKFSSLLRQPELTADDFFNLLYDDQQAIDSQLPNTGIGLERERALSSMFIKTPNYGSRCSTVVLVDNQNHAQFSERVYDLTTFNYSLSRFDFTIPHAE